MELTAASTKSQTLAPLTGPNPQTFSFKGGIGLPELIRGSWRGGGLVTPSDTSIFYAADGTTNASETYFSDEIHRPDHPNPIRVFLGPAVSQAVVGNAWGLEAEMDCRLVTRDALKLL
jgi:hypothetical protein